MKLKCALTAAALTLTSAPLAHADDVDDQFLASLSRDGLNMAPDQAISYAHQICDAENLSPVGIAIPPLMPDTPSPRTLELRRIEDDLLSQGLTTPETVTFRRDAITTYCPDKISD
jgi:hypothetical protein